MRTAHTFPLHSTIPGRHETLIPMNRPVQNSATALPVLALLAFTTAATSAAPLVIDITYNQPTLDRWFYPFCCSFPPTGSEFESRIFAPTTKTGLDPSFDNRDGQMLIVFATAADIPTGLGADQYTITQAAVTLEVSSDQTFGYDPTPDPWTSWLMPDDPMFTPDPDPGRAIELFGAGWRNGFSALTFPENGPYSAVGPFGQGVRNAFPLQFNSQGQPIDVSNNVTMGFDPAAWAVGMNPSLVQGQFVPIGADLTFEINVSDTNIQNYLRAAANSGRFAFVIASLFPAVQQQTGTFPRLYCKEHPNVIAGLAGAARLHLNVLVGDVPPIIGDLNHDGLVNGLDLGILLINWSIPPGAPGCGGTLPCESDLNADGQVNGLDLGILLGNWTL
jgi:hypothetical protein